MNEELIAYYGKYNEDKRLTTPYGRVEYLTTLRYIDRFSAGRTNLAVLEAGAATGRYSLEMARRGHDVTAVDLVRYNIGILKQKASREGLLEHVKAYVGDARKLKKVTDASQDLVLIFGPLYHVFSEEDKVAILKEGARVLKPGGKLFAAYIMNEFAVVTYGFHEGHILESEMRGKLDEDFHVRNSEEDLFSFDRLEDMERYRKAAGLRRVMTVAQDGPVNYMREDFKNMTDDVFQEFLRYHWSVCERKELLGASCHVLDILEKRPFAGKPILIA
jgi:2-polyprenyl-3-methyl-5-hydroxy-6-metoxy-1,4-benzoquinol methylase